MKNTFTIYIFLCALIVAMYGCNPDCDSVINMNVSIASADAILADRDNQILLKSSPPNFLEGRQVFMDNPSRRAQRVKLDEENTFFDTTLNGLVVTIPESLAQVGDPAIYVDDPDCSSDVLLVQPLQIRTQDFFFFSDLFIVPPIPIVIIPLPAVVPPAGITNAWIAPYERSYCIWFVPEKDEQGKELNELRPYLPGIDDEKKKADPKFMLGSHEFVVCDAVGRHENADKNPVSGFVDQETGMIEIKIDRSSKGLGVERFNGMFVDDDQLPDSDAWRNGFAGCNTQISDDRRVEFMLLTSQNTGAQLLMIKALNL